MEGFGPADGRTERGGAERAPLDGVGQDLTIDFTDVDWLARIVAAAGPSVVAVSPPELVRQVTALLRVAADSQVGASA